MKQILIITFILTVLFISLFALTANATDIHAEGGIYAEWVWSSSRGTWTYFYGQRFGGTVLAIEGIMFQEPDTCTKYEGETRRCTWSDYRFIRKALKNFQSDPTVIIMPDWVSNYGN